LATRVNLIIDYMFGILTSKAIDWYIYESILRGSGGGSFGGARKFGGGIQKFSGPLPTNNISVILSSNPVKWHPCWVI